MANGLQKPVPVRNFKNLKGFKCRYTFRIGALEMRYFRVCPYSEGAELALSSAAGVGREEKNEKNGSA
jgi:hypothetical protein